MISRVLQWLWFEVAGEVWSPSMAARGFAPTLRWACTGREADARREAYSPAEAFRAGMREAELEALRFELGEVRAELERLRAAPGQPAPSEPATDLVAPLRRVGWTSGPVVAERPPLAAGQRWRSAGGHLVTMRKRTDISAGFNLDAVFPNGAILQFNTGEPAPDGWTFLGTVEPPQLRIERRADGEYLVGASGMPNDCEEVSPDGERLCTRHLDDQHLSCSGCAEEGPLKIAARWPIAAESGEPEADPRWREGAVWEHRADVVRRLELRQVEGELAALRVQGTWGAIQTVRRADMTEEKGWGEG